MMIALPVRVSEGASSSKSPKNALHFFNGAWFDVLMHGAPWVWLGYVAKQSFFSKKTEAVIETEVLKVGKE